MAAFERIAWASYDRMIGLARDDLSADGCITKAPCGGEVAGRSPVDRGKQGLKRSRFPGGQGGPRWELRESTAFQYRIKALPARGKCRKFERSCPSPAGALDQSLWCGNSFARPWKDRILGFWITPSRISIARRIVWSVSHAAGPASTVPRYGSSASLISQVAESQR